MKRALRSRAATASGMMGTPRTYTWKPSGSTRKAARAGVDVRLRVEPGGFHVYVLGVPTIPEAEAVLDHSARFISGILTQA